MISNKITFFQLIKNYFRDPEGDYVLFGDVKQNIYGQTTQNKDVVTNVRGVNELKYCYRCYRQGTLQFFSEVQHR